MPDQTPDQTGPVVAYTPQQVALVKSQLLRPKGRTATDEELHLFLATCQRYKLDPFAGQICGVYRKQGGGSDEERMTIQVQIDGYRALAEEHPQFDGMDGPLYCGKDGQWVDVWLDDDLPLACRVIVHRKDRKGPIPWTVYFDAYAETYNGKLAHRWAIDPLGMIAKCAEAGALRRAFSRCAGAYTNDEMPDAGLAPMVTSDGDRPALAAPADTEGEVIDSEFSEAAVATDEQFEVEQALIRAFDGVTTVASAKTTAEAYETALGNGGLHPSSETRVDFAIERAKLRLGQKHSSRPKIAELMAGAKDCLAATDARAAAAARDVFMDRWEAAVYEGHVGETGKANEGLVTKLAELTAHVTQLDEQELEPPADDDEGSTDASPSDMEG